MGLAINVKSYIYVYWVQTVILTVYSFQVLKQLKMYLMAILQTNGIVMDIAGKWVDDKYFLLEKLQIARLIMLFDFFTLVYILSRYDYTNKM